MNNMTISRKLQLMIGIAIAALCIGGFTSFYGISRVSSALTSMQKNTVPSLLTIGEIDALFIEYRLAVHQHLLASTGEVMTSREKNIAGITEKLDTLLAKYEKTLAIDSKDKAMILAEKQALQEYRASADRVLQQSKAFNKDVALSTLELETAALGGKLEEALKAHVEYNNQLAAAAEQSSSASARISLTVSSIISLMAFWSLFWAELRLSAASPNPCATCKAQSPESRIWTLPPVPMPARKMSWARWQACSMACSTNYKPI